jgi:hypothetical protein
MNPFLLFLLALSGSAAAAPRDEGMWTFDNPPLERLAKDHGFEPTPSWFEHVRLACVRFPGGSGSFVSADGLVLTNHHVGFDAIQKLSTEEADLVKDGFYAPTRDRELRCQDLELVVLESTEDVTARVQGAVGEGATPKEANDQRKAEMARIEKEEKERTGLDCTVVNLYSGGAYHLYRYRKHTDVRLVFAPEAQIAFYGGDPDNFTFPRFDLDCAFFRVYEEDKPYRPKHYFAWSGNGPQEGDLVFVSGNPGSTGRLDTTAKLEYIRDVQYPQTLRRLTGLRSALRAFSARGEEQARRAKDDLFGVENSIKAITGYLSGLQDARIFANKEKAEREFGARIVWDTREGQDYRRALEAIAKARKDVVPTATRFRFSSFSGTLSPIAVDLVRMTAELEKPNEDRLPEYRDSALDSLERRLYSTQPIYLDLEEAMLAEALRQSLAELGPDDPFVKTALGGRTPEEAAAGAIRGTKLVDVEERKRLGAGGTKAIEASTDPTIALARAVDPITRGLRKKIEDELESVETVAGERLAELRFRTYGKSVWPDATFTLRLSYGTVKGYEEDTTLVPWKTTYFGLFERHAAFDGKPPYDLPERWLEKRERLDLSTPLNFVCTADIIGGNSGSPVVNRDAELVGLIFDGNIQSLPNRFVYDDEMARAVAVHSAGILEALRKVYDAGALADELVAKGD